MRVLYHLTLSPFARKVRLVLAEKNLDFTLKLEKVWERRAEFLALNPAGDVPVLIEPDGTVLAGTDAIVEYLDEVYREKILIGINPVDRAEVRRLSAWFDTKMNLEVTENLLGEKMMRRFQGFSQPNSQAIRAGHANLPAHLDYIGYLVERRRWLAGDHFSAAHITPAPHLSALDYLGDVPWDAHEPAKEWYARIKSRPSFRQILSDHVPGVAPPKHYPDLDFCPVSRQDQRALRGKFLGCQDTRVAQFLQHSQLRRAGRCVEGAHGPKAHGDRHSALLQQNKGDRERGGAKQKQDALIGVFRGETGEGAHRQEDRSGRGGLFRGEIG